MRKPFKLLIAVPCTDYMHADFVTSLVKLTNHLNREGVRHEVNILPGTLVYLARNKLAYKVINGDYTHILFIDSDMVFDESIVETMTFCGKDFVCGAFQSRRPKYGACVYKKLQPLIKVEDYGKEPFQVAGCGMAGVMISKEILKAVNDRFGTCFDPVRIEGVAFGEDLAFCWRVNQIGEKMWCDPTARLGHIAHVTIWPGEEPAT